MKGGQVVTHPCVPLQNIEFFLRWSLRCTHTARSLTCVLVVVCVARNLRLCPATVGVGTVLIWDFCVACTKGGGG